MSILIFGIKWKHHSTPSASFTLLLSPIKHLKGSSIRNGSRNAQLTPNYPTGVVGHRVITFTAVPFKTRLFMHSHFGGRSRVYGFRRIGKSSNDKIVDRRPQRRVAKKLEWSEFSSVRNFSFSFSFFLGQHPPVDI